jgi:enamine deaminase RidA (YjgF/YER057c/UK114 family)
MLKASLLSLCSLTCLQGQEIRHINPEGMSKSPAYSQIVTAKPGTVIWISGQVAQDSNGQLVGKGNLKAQLNQVWANLKLALAASGATFKDVVKINTYVVNCNPSMQANSGSRLKPGPGRPPASTLVGVQALASKSSWWR